MQPHSNEEHGVWEAEITVTIGQPLYYNYITLDPQTRLIRWEDSPVRTCIFSEFSRVVNDIVPFPQKNETSTWSHNEGWITTETQLRLSFGYGDVTTGPLLSPLSMEKTYFDIQLRISCVRSLNIKLVFGVLHDILGHTKCDGIKPKV